MRSEKRLTLRVKPDFHTRVKLAAIKRNMSMKDFIMQTIEMRLKKFDLFKEK